MEEIAAKRDRLISTRSSRRQRALQIAANLYVAAFLQPKGESVRIDQNTAAIPTTADVWQAVKSQPPAGPLVDAACRLAEEARAFHWPLAFPDILATGGFDIVIGNPPWERVKLQEEEFFASREPEIANAKNAAARKKLIALLPRTNPTLASEWAAAARRAAAESTFFRLSGRFPFGGVGDVNTYAVFADHFRQSIRPTGIAALLLPNGLVTGFTYRSFLRHLLKTRTIASFYGFENEEKIFPDVHNETKFGILTITGPERPVQRPWFTAHLRQPKQLGDPLRRYSLTSEQIEAINPNTLNLPVFRWKTDADVSAAIHAIAPVLIHRHEGGRVDNPWRVSFRTLFHMANDSSLFLDHADIAPQILYREDALAVLPDDRRVYPLYEGKMLWYFDHRYGTYQGQTEKQANKGVLPHVDDTAHDDPAYRVQPRYWVDADSINDALGEARHRQWFYAWRDVGPTERTFVGTVLPKVGLGHTASLIIPSTDALSFAAFAAVLSSMVVDYDARQRSNRMSFFVVEQLSIVGPDSLATHLPYLGTSPRNWLANRVLELCYTNVELAPFAVEMDFDYPPFKWQPERRAVIQAEIDALVFKLYALSREQIEWIIDSFGVLRKYEERDQGEFRTRRLVIEIYDALTRAEQSSNVYKTPLYPPPGDPRSCHPPMITIPTSAPVSAPPAIEFASLPDAAWANPNPKADASLAQIAALIRALPGPTPIAHVRLAAIFVLEPRYLSLRLPHKERNTWSRLVGPAADLLKDANVVEFAPTFPAGWRNAVTQLLGMRAITEVSATRTWAAGPGLDQFVIDKTAWPYGRATFVLEVLSQINLDEALADLPDDEQAWVRASAA